MAFLRIKAKEIDKNTLKLLLYATESLRSMKILHLAFLSRSEARKIIHLLFLSHSEAWKISICYFWVAQKHKKPPFGLSESLRSIEIYFFHTYVVDRNTYFLFFALMSLTETIIFNFWPFWNVQKHENPPFALSETFRSIKILHLAFLKCSEAWKSSIWPFWKVQKHEKPLFGLSETFRSMKTRKLFARLPYNLYFCMQMKIYLT